MVQDIVLIAAVSWYNIDMKRRSECFFFFIANILLKNVDKISVCVNLKESKGEVCLDI